MPPKQPKMLCIFKQHAKDIIEPTAKSNRMLMLSSSWILNNIARQCKILSTRWKFWVGVLLDINLWHMGNGKLKLNGNTNLTPKLEFELF